MRYVISKEIASASKSSCSDSDFSTSDLDEDGRDDNANNVSYLIKMH